MPPEPMPEPVTPLAQGAAQLAELYLAYTRAGIPPICCAVMLGTAVAIIMTQQQGDG